VLRLYDTRRQQAEQIEPTRRSQLRVYSCGPTVDRYAHLGNLRTFLLPDLIRRTAHRHRVTVLACESITDVGHLADDGQLDAAGEDKVLAAARAAGKPALELARYYADACRADCSALNIRPPEHSPRASESIGLMTELIARLISAGHAYPAGDGSVYFDARSFAGYGELSGHRLDDAPARAGRDDGLHPGRRFYGDWALWQGAPASGELTWTAPWGPGFPGWHIECSAMSLHHLGDVIDIHTGGTDLRFPHHENIRAQSNSLTGHEVVRHWVHGGQLWFDGARMAPSAGNVVLLADLVARGLDPLALRLAFLEHRYRQQLNLTWAALAAADATLRRWRQQVSDWATHPSRPMSAPHVAQMAGAFDDDLDTPAAIRALRALAASTRVAPGSKFETFAHIDQLFGLDLARDLGRPPAPLPLPPRGQALLAQRAAALEQEDGAGADRLQEELAGLGVTVSDTPAGQHWTVERAD
jgi:cysteinyl-tRNA synthetase